MKELKKLMEKPILKKDANTVLFDLMGDDMLFDFFDELDDDDDVRPAVYDHLKRMSKMKRSGFRKPEALDFINQLVKDLKEFE